MTFQTFNELGYLEQPYLEEPHLTSTAHAVGGIQFTGQIVGTEVVTGMQFTGQIVDSLDITGMQFQGFIDEYQQASGSQYLGQILNTENVIGGEFTGQIVDSLDIEGAQYLGQIQNTENVIGMQFTGQIIDSENTTGMQFLGQILALEDANGMQFQADIGDISGVIGGEWQHSYWSHRLCFDGYLTGPYLQEPYLTDQMCASGGFQFDAFVGDSKQPYGMQFQGEINDTEDTTGMQFQGEIKDTEVIIGMQFQGFIDDFETPVGMQFLSNVIEYFNVEVYGGMQFTGQITPVEPVDGLGMQFTAQTLEGLGMQFLVALYNTTNLRILCDFPSRGSDDTTGVITSVYTHVGPGNITSIVKSDHGMLTGQFIRIENTTNNIIPGVYEIVGVSSSATFEIDALFSSTPSNGTLDWYRVNSWGTQFGEGLNWNANSTAAGDFSPNNLNTDFVEEVWRSNGQLSNVRLDCDTELAQGIRLDTLGIINHNLTQGATVTLIGSNSSNFSPVGFQTSLEITPTNMYYIAPTLPIESFRYWRFEINDATNNDGYIEIGTIVFGASRVFQGECFVDEIEFQLQDFADTVDTEGFTNVSNSRAQRRRLGLEFRFLDFLKGNFGIMRDIFTNRRTVLKCLWIPTPDPVDMTVTDRFAVFAKLTSIPSERHNNKGPDNDYVSFTIDLDESK